MSSDIDIMASKTLDVICFTVEKLSIQKIDELIEQKLYFSRSEILRNAVRLLLIKLTINQSSMILSIINFNNNFRDEEYPKKKQTCARLPHLLVNSIDRAINYSVFANRSHFIRESIKLFLAEHEFFQLYFEQENNNKRLQAITCKIPVKQLTAIKNLCKQGYYSNLSETVRIAITDYISYIYDYTEVNKSDFRLPLLGIDLLQQSKKTNKVQICSKIPIYMLKVIDTFILNYNPFMTRHNFICLAIERFLNNDLQIYEYWLNNEKPVFIQEQEYSLS